MFSIKRELLAHLSMIEYSNIKYQMYHQFKSFGYKIKYSLRLRHTFFLINRIIKIYFRWLTTTVFRTIIILFVACYIFFLLLRWNDIRLNFQINKNPICHDLKMNDFITKYNWFSPNTYSIHTHINPWNWLDLKHNVCYGPICICDCVIVSSVWFIYWIYNNEINRMNQMWWPQIRCLSGSQKYICWITCC